MKKYLVWMALCVGAALARADAANSINFGDFTVTMLPGQRAQVFNKTRPEQTREYTLEHAADCGESFLVSGDFNQDGFDDFASLCIRNRDSSQDVFDASRYIPATGGSIFRYVPHEQAFSHVAGRDPVYNSTAVGGFYIAQASNEDETQRKIYVIKKSSRRLTQIIDLADYETIYWPDAASIQTGDFNFDGREDFSIFENSYAGANQSRVYFWYNPEKDQFDDGIVGLSWQFDARNKIITSVNQCCAGSMRQEERFTVRGNQLVELGTRCFMMDLDLPEEKYGEEMSWLEHDCDSALVFSHLASVGQKKPIQVRLKILDKKMTRGVALYSGQKEHLNLRLKHRSGKTLVYDELHKGKLTGSYTLNLDDENAVFSARYVRKKDGKGFDFVPVSPTAGQ
jgi:hypothetical protein